MKLGFEYVINSVTLAYITSANLTSGTPCRISSRVYYSSDEIYIEYF